MQADRKHLSLGDLDHLDSAILKALAITAIALHNFFHFVSPVRQNEFAFHPGRFHILIHTLEQPPLAIQALLSFFGHYGVQVFVFLSAYGLARSHWDDRASWPEFMWSRIRKLYPSFLLVVFIWSVLMCAGMGPLRFSRELGPHLLLMLAGLSTLVGFGLPPVGPWWFIPFIVQFYALWPLLRSFTKRFGGQGLLALSFASIALTFAVTPLLPASFNLLLTPIGRLPVLALGIFAARSEMRLPAWLGILGFAVLLAGGRYELIWIFTPVGSAVAFLWTYMLLRDRLRRYAWVQRLGEYSLFVFLINGIVRTAFIPFAVSPASELILGFSSLASSIAIAAFLQEIVMPGNRGRRAVDAAESARQLRPVVAGQPELKQQMESLAAGQ